MTFYLITHWQPISGLFIGLLMLALYYYLHFKAKDRVAFWIAKHIFRNQNRIASAGDLFNVVTSFLFMFGGIWVIVAIYYLSNG